MWPATIDITALREARQDDPAHAAVVASIAAACSETGFFCVEGHGIEPTLGNRLVDAAKGFFAQSEEAKAEISMDRGGRAWRGWFPLGGELTSGEADAKEGIYFGTDLPPTHPAVLASTPLHGANLYPREPEGLAGLVDEWMAAVTAVGQELLKAMALGLGLEADWFDRWCAEPLVMFRIFHYPAPPVAPEVERGVAEHTDYGLLTLLAQDDTGGLEVEGPGGWEAVAPSEGVIVCNLGDMLERTTGGRYRSTLHRVRRPERDRISMPLFLDPNWNALVEPVDGVRATRTGAVTWDGSDPLEGPTRYGDYLSAKVSRVFPELFDSAIGSAGTGRSSRN